MQRRRSRPPVPLLGRQRADGAADVLLQQVDQLFVRAAVERLDQQDAGRRRALTEETGIIDRID